MELAHTLTCEVLGSAVARFDGVNSSLTPNGGEDPRPS